MTATTTLQSPAAAQVMVKPKARPGFRLWDGFGTALLNLFAWLVLFAYLFPMVYMAATAFKDESQLTQRASPPWPATQVKFEYEGKSYGVYEVPTETGTHQWALVNKRRAYSEFVDPLHPEQGLIHWEGYWGSLEAVYKFEYTWDNFVQLWDGGDFLKPVWNTLIIAALGGTGVLVSSILVAYGFARFPVPAGRWLFIILIATIMLPEKVTLIPTYFMYTNLLDWTGTWLPLIVPHFFGNAIMIFLLRQNFKSIPKDIEEAAVLDGAGPVRLLISIILPQAVPTVLTVALLQFFYFWNETRMAALYVSTNSKLFPISFWLQHYGTLGPNLTLLQASALMVMIVPVVVLFLAQREFMQGVVVTGTEK